MVENLKNLRNKKGLTQAQLAELLVISQQSINKYENQNAEPDIETLKNLADLFNTSIDYLVGYSEIDHKIEKTEKYDLNYDEIQLINGYRKLNQSEKDSLHCIINNYNSSKKITDSAVSHCPFLLFILHFVFRISHF